MREQRATVKLKAQESDAKLSQFLCKTYSHLRNTRTILRSTLAHGEKGLRSRRSRHAMCECDYRQLLGERHENTIDCSAMLKFIVPSPCNLVRVQSAQDGESFICGETIFVLLRFSCVGVC